MKNEKKPTQEEKDRRVDVVNQIIKEIASRGRRFFHKEDSKTGTETVAYLYRRNGKIFYKCEWVSRHNPVTEVCFSAPKYRRLRGFPHGGTLESLIRDFCEYIKGNDEANHVNGYGGLYCPHWGYPDEDMKAIQTKAVELGYLKLRQKGGEGD